MHQASMYPYLPPGLVQLLDIVRLLAQLGQHLFGLLQLQLALNLINSTLTHVQQRGFME